MSGVVKDAVEGTPVLYPVAVAGFGTAGLMLPVPLPRLMYGILATSCVVGTGLLIAKAYYWVTDPTSLVTDLQGVSNFAQGVGLALAEAEGNSIVSIAQGIDKAISGGPGGTVGEWEEVAQCSKIQDTTERNACRAAASWNRYTFDPGNDTSPADSNNWSWRNFQQYSPLDAAYFQLYPSAFRWFACEGIKDKSALDVGKTIQQSGCNNDTSAYGNRYNKSAQPRLEEWRALAAAGKNVSYNAERDTWVFWQQRTGTGPSVELPSSYISDAGLRHPVNGYKDQPR